MSKRPSTLPGQVHAGTLLGPALASPIVAWIIAVSSWRVSFYITGALGIVWAAIWVSLVSTPERTRWLSEPERQHILANRQVAEAPVSGSGVGYLGLLRSPSMWGLAISQGCAVYSLYLYLSWLPTYLQTARHVSMVNSGLFNSVPFLVGAFVIIITNWIGDRFLTPSTMQSGRRRLVVVTCLLLASAGMVIPFVESLGLVVFLTILPISFGNTASATNAALTSDLLRSPADSGRAFAFLVLGGNVFGLLAPIITGYIVQATGSFASAFVLAGVLALLGAIISLTLTRHTIGENPTLAASPQISYRHAGSTPV